jgi:hypothetical protein
MKRLNAVLILALAILGAAVSTSAPAAHYGGHVRFGVYLGPGYWYPPPYYTYPPYYSPYYYPPAVAAPAAPPTYVEQGVAPPVQAAPAQPQGYWYYCDGSKAYYPYVKECPGGWQRVAPQPAN